MCAKTSLGIPVLVIDFCLPFINSYLFCCLLFILIYSAEQQSQGCTVYMCAADCLGFSDKTHPYPCRSTQFTFKMLQQLSTNLTVSHLEACKTLANKIQPTSPLLTSGLFLPSSLKRFTSHSVDQIARWSAALGISTPPPLLHSTTAAQSPGPAVPLL